MRAKKPLVIILGFGKYSISAMERGEVVPTLRIGRLAKIKPCGGEITPDEARNAPLVEIAFMNEESFRVMEIVMRSIRKRMSDRGAGLGETRTFKTQKRDAANVWLAVPPKKTRAKKVKA